MDCKRSLDCTCPMCAAAAAEFSVEDLKQFSSTIDYGADGGEGDDAEPPPPPPPKPKPVAKRKPAPRAVRKPDPKPVAAAPIPPVAADLAADALPSVPQTAAGAEEGDIADGPLEDRLPSKDWKVRKSAYQQMKSMFERAQSGDDEVFSQHAPFLRGMIQDSNASCLDVALEAVLIFADTYNQASQHSSEVAPGIVAKGLSGRPGTATRAEEALLKFMEVDTPEVVVGVLLEGLSDKKPKVPPACVVILTKALQMFGPRAMPLKDLKAQLPGMLSHKVVAVRPQALALAAEIVSWCGQPMLASVISELRPAQQSELDNLVKEKAEQSPGPRVPTVYLRKDRLSKADQAEGKAEPAAAAFDPREFMEAVDILSKLPKTEFSKKLAATKWSEILEGLNIAVDLIGPVPKLAAGDYGDLVQKVKRLGDHSHVQVASTAHRLLALLAEGLGSGFQPYCKSVVAAMLVKLKDKKCVAVLGSCLDKVYGNPHSLDQVLDETVASLDPKKAIHSRLAVLEWISRCVAKSKPSVDPATLVALARGTVRLVDDSDAKIREASGTTLAAIANASRGATGPSPQIWTIVQELQNTNARAFKRIRDLVGSTGGESTQPADERKPSASAGTGRGKSSTAAAASDKPGPGSRAGTGNAGSAQPSSGRSRPASRASSKAPPKAKPAPSSTAGQRKAAASSSAADRGGGADDGNDDAISMSPEEAMDKLESLGIEGWGESVVPGLRGTAWKQKVASIECLGQGATSDPSQYLGPLVLVLAAHTKQFKDSNFNVLKAAFSAVKTLLDAGIAGGDTRASCAAVAVALAPAVDKLGDRKLQETTSSLLTSAAESLGPSWVARRVAKVAGQAKAPLARSEALGWLNSCVEDFGAGVLPVPQLVTFATSELEHVNPKVRSSSLELLGSLYHRLGPPLKALLPSELRPALQSQVDDIFNKVGYDPAANAQVKRKAPGADGEDQSAGAGGGGLPRMDLSTLLDKDCLTRMGCVKGKDAWKGRKAAMEEVIQACSKSGNHLEANKFAVEVVKTLTPRLSDSQSNLKPLAASALAEVAASVTPDSAIKLTRIYAEPLLGCVADNRKMMRDAAITALEKVTSANGELHVPSVEAIMGPVVVAMANKVGRIELLTWLKAVVPRIPAGEGATSLVSPLLACMQDKSAEVRQRAQECLSGLVVAGTVQPSRVRTATRDFQPAVMRQLKPALEKILESSGPSTTDVEASDAVGNSAPASAPAVVSKLVRGATGASAPPGSQNRRSARAAISQKVESSVGETDAKSTAPGGALLATNTKARRIESEKRTRWIVSSDEPRDHQTAALKMLWSPLLRPDAIDALFPARVGSMECGAAGVELLSRALREQKDAFLDSLDLVFKWISLRLCEKENVKALGQLLQFLGETFDALVAMQYRLEDMEIDALLPTLLEKSGQAKERFRVAFRGLLASIPPLCPYAKYSPLLLQATTSKNSRTRIACLSELSRCIEQDGPASVLGKKGLKELAKHVDADQAEVRSAALDAIESCYVRLDMDSARIHRLMGPVNDKTKTLIEERMKAADRKHGGKASATTSQTGARALGEATDTTSGLHQHSGVDQAPVSPRYVGPDEGAEDAVSVTSQTSSPHAEAHVDRGQRASLGGLEGDASFGDFLPGSANYSSPETGAPLFQFDCNDLEVVLSPRTREREAGNTASETAFWALLKEVEMGLLQHESLAGVLPDTRRAAVQQIKGLANWASAQESRKGGETLLARHHSRLIMTLVQCLRLAFTGAPPLADCDMQYASVEGTGGIDLELAPQVVTALDDVCSTSARFFDEDSLGALLGEVCRWLVEQRLGPHALHGKYKACDPYGQVQQKLNRVATASRAASLSVSVAALLNVMAAAHSARAEHNANDKVSRQGKRFLETKLLKVYVKLLAHLSKEYDQSKVGGNSAQGQDGFGSVSLPSIMRGLHKYHVAEIASGTLELDAEEGRAYEGSTRIVSKVCEQLHNAWGSSALRSCANSVRVQQEGSTSDASVSEEAWRQLLRRLKSSPSESNTTPTLESSTDGGRRHSSPILGTKSDHVAEIARLIGLVSADSQRERDGGGEDNAGALNELKSYLQSWPEAYATLEDQVDRLKPRFRQFILDGCRELHATDNVAQSTPLQRGRTSDIHRSWSSSRGGQNLEAARMSLAFEGDENTLRPASHTLDVAQVREDTLSTRTSDRLQDIRRRMGGVARTGAARVEGHSSLGASLRSMDRPQPLKQTNNLSAADIQERLRGGRVQAKPPQDPVDSQGLARGGATLNRTSLAERFKRRNG